MPLPKKVPRPPVLTRKEKARNEATKRAAMERRMDLLAPLLFKGYSQNTIAEALGVSRDIVRADTIRLAERWQQSADEYFARGKERELQKLMHLEGVYWDAWDRSRNAKTTRKLERIPDDPDQVDQRTPAQIIAAARKAKAKRANKGFVKGEFKGVEELLSLTEAQITESDGNPEFLRGVMACIRERSNMMGFYPERAGAIGDVPPAQITNQAMVVYLPKFAEGKPIPVAATVSPA